MRLAYLFDVDGTLVKTGGAGSRALNRAFAELYGIPDAMARVRPHGKTDYAICREAFAAMGRARVEVEEIARVVEVYLPLLEEEVRDSATYEVLAGVLPMLEALTARGEIVGIASGNIERGAHTKIARGGLNRFFRFGGFGDDAEERAELVKVAWARAEAIAGAPLPGAQVYVIGDTDLDVIAARRAGCRAVAVASGWDEIAALRESGPDYLFGSLEGALGREPFV